jgi:ABC-2 type transport system ATP-binding protein
VNAGECYGLVGPNGAGKTTLIRILLGLILPDEGEARLFGLRPDLPENRRRVGFVPESAELPHGATPLQLMQRWAVLKGLNPRLALEEGERHLLRLGMKDFLHRPAHRFSKGEKQRTLIALALLGQPDLLVLDEPTDGLDPLGRALIRGVVAEECAAGRTVVLNSHLLSETERVCTRVGILHGGRLVREESLDRTAHAGEQGVSVIHLSAPLQPAEALEIGIEATNREAQYVARHAGVDELNTIIDRLRTRGARLIELRRKQASVEDMLVEIASRPPGPEPETRAFGIEELAQPPRPLTRGTRAVLSVAREIGADLRARRILHVGAGAAFLVLAGLLYAARAEIAQGLAATGRLLGQGHSDAAIQHAGATIGMGLARVSHWLLLFGATFLAALFAPPLIEPRRGILLQAQPVSRGDIATGIFLAVCVITGIAFAAFDLAVFGTARYLGAAVPLRFLCVPFASLVTFAAIYAGTLCATNIFPSGLFSGFVGVAQLIGFSILNDLPAGQLGKSHGFLGFLLGLVPRPDDLDFAAGRLGEGAWPPRSPSSPRWFTPALSSCSSRCSCGGASDEPARPFPSATPGRRPDDFDRGDPLERHGDLVARPLESRQQGARAHPFPHSRVSATAGRECQSHPTTSAAGGCGTSQPEEEPRGGTADGEQGLAALHPEQPEVRARRDGAPERHPEHPVRPEAESLLRSGGARWPCRWRHWIPANA